MNLIQFSFYGILCSAFICLVGCNKTPKVYYSDNHSDLRIVKIDNCEYIKFSTHGSWGYCHKGNCTNSIHIYNKN